MTPGSGTALTANIPVDMVALLEQANVKMLKPFWIMSPKMKSWIKNLKTTAAAYIYRDEMNKDKTIEARKDATADKVDAEYTVAKEKCNTFAGGAKDTCLDQVKARFGKS